MGTEPMGCDAVRLAAYDFVEGEVDPGMASEIRAHLAACEECEGRVAEIRRLGGLLRTWEIPHPPDGFPEGVIAALERGVGSSAEPRRRSRVLRIPWPVAAAAALLLTASLAFNALWILFRARLSPERPAPRIAGTSIGAPASLGAARGERPGPGAIRPAFFLYLDPTDEGPLRDPENPPPAGP